jgi:ADP-ribose pyrophosphatase YjhB (NUDIX family)
MTRIDHLHNPDAPAPNSIVPACTVVARNNHGAVLLIRRTDNNLWALPGGAMEFGESITQPAVREVEEETGIQVLITGLVGIYTDPHHLVEFSDGEVRQQFSICFTARPTGGAPTTSDESSDVRYVQPRCLDELEIHPSMRLRIDHALAERTVPYLG